MTPQVEASNLITPVINIFKAINNEWYELMETGLSDYLQNQTEKYYFTNTFLHRAEKVVFDNIYFPIKASYIHLVTDFSELENVLDEYSSIALIGSAGSGKTTLIKYIFLHSIRLRARIPVLVELRRLNDVDDNIEKLISDKILKSRLKPTDNILQRAMRSGKFLFLLDGYDEIFSTKKQQVNKQIEDFIDAYPGNKFIVTTRPGSGLEGFDRLFNFEVRELEKQEIVEFISKMVNNKERRGRIIKVVEDVNNSSYLEFLKNPLLLSMFILAFETHPEIPGRKSAFYRNVFDTLYSKHDGITKNSYPREKLSGLQFDDFEKLLCMFSYMASVDGRYTFTYEYFFDKLQEVKQYFGKEFNTQNLIYDLHTSISVIMLDGFEYSFPHRSMQEYFSALFISGLDTDDKGEAYANLLDTLRKASNDDSHNLWSLCFELDEVIFIKSFLIPSLQAIYRRLEGDDNAKLIKSFLTVINANLYSFNDEPFKIYRSANFEHAVLAFCNIYNYMDDVWSFPVTSGCVMEFDKIEYQHFPREEGANEVKKIDLTRDDALEILSKYNFTPVVLKVKESIAEKIEQWNSSIAQQKRSLGKLLSKKSTQK
jgi:hypothetical protein